MIPSWLILWLIGVALVAIGYTRARVPWSRYQALREQQANVARYEAWRGGLRTTEDGPTGASVAMAQLRRQAQAAGLIAIIGFALIFVGFLLR
jgi:uncharacterized membrane protein